MKKFFKASILCLLMVFCFYGMSFADDYFKNTELQFHVDSDRDLGIEGADKTDILTVTLEHFSEWKYGDNYFFVDIEGKDSYHSEADQVYFEISPRFSINRIAGIENFGGIVSEVYLAFQYNDSDKDYINSAFLYGASVDFNFHQPNYGFSNLSIYSRQVAHEDDCFQATFVWGQPFSIGPLNMAFNGFFDIYEQADRTVFISEPQLRLNLSSFAEQGGFLSSSCIGMEFEVTKDFYVAEAGWILNPTIFYAFSF